MGRRSALSIWADIQAKTLDELRALADRIESRECTGLSASWCPVHGDCTCPEPLEALDADACPLHSDASSHAEDGTETEAKRV